MFAKIKGGLLGVIIGDALGLPVQFLSRSELQANPVQTMQGYGTFNLPPGSWSDDSSLTLCLTESLCNKGYDLDDIGERFIRWYKEGYWTPFGESFDIGRTTTIAMENLIEGKKILEAGPKDERSNGNGSLMRIMPAVLYFSHLDLEEFGQRLCEVSQITHGHPRSQLACVLYGLLVKSLLYGETPKEAYTHLKENAPSIASALNLDQELPAFKRILKADLVLLPESQINSSGYVVDTLEAALWCLLRGETFRDVLLQSVNLGEDTDTVGAVTGGLAGTYYGIKAVPDEWLKNLMRSEDIFTLLNKFAELISA